MDTVALNGIEYRDLRRYRYQLASAYIVALGWPVSFAHRWFELRGGVLTVCKGYAWDGSTMAPDTDACRRASLVHDALCQAIGLWLLGPQWQQPADELYRSMCVDDGMTRVRAWLRYRALRRYDQVNPTRRRRRHEYEEKVDGHGN
jgi:hypothetical protein